MHFLEFQFFFVQFRFPRFPGVFPGGHVSEFLVIRLDDKGLLEFDRFEIDVIEPDELSQFREESLGVDQ